MLVFLMGILFAKPLENPMSLAAQLARDGELARAESVLSGIEPATLGQDVSLFYITKGLISLHKKETTAALEAFLEAQPLLKPEEREKSEKLSLYIAQCYLILRKPTEALAELGTVTTTGLSVFLMKIDAFSQKEEWVHAYQVLIEGRRIFPSENALLVQEVCITSKLGLLTSVRTMLDIFVEQDDLQEKELFANGWNIARGWPSLGSIFVFEFGKKAIFLGGVVESLCHCRFGTTRMERSGRHLGCFVDREAKLCT